MHTLCKTAFWQFSCQLYQQGEQQKHLLALQNAQNKNVNLCLLLHYLDSVSLQLSAQQLVILEQSIADFDYTIMQPLRSARQAIKQTQQKIPQYQTIRRHLLDAELELEKQQQHILIDTVNTLTLTSTDNPNNPALYF